MRATRILQLSLALTGALLLATCATNPVTGRQNFVTLSEADEVQAGRKADPEVRQEYGVYSDAELARYVESVGQKLAKSSHRPGLQYRFTVLDSPDVNAFALPGGYIYITRGLMVYLGSEAELAAVLGHEVGHVTARHSVQQMSAATAAGVTAALIGIVVPQLGGQAGQSLLGAAGGALLSGYGRDHELEADRLGAEYLARTGYDPQAMIRVIGVLKNQELFDAAVAKQEGREPRRYHGLFASHPDNDTRLKEVVGEANRYQVPRPVESRAEFLKHMDGVAFGSSAEQGYIRAGQFVHPTLGFALRIPEGWRGQNRHDRFQAVNAAKDAGIELRLAGKPQGSPADTLRRGLKLGAGQEVRSTTVNGLPAATTSLIRDGKPLLVEAVHLGDHAYVIAGVAASSSAFDANRAAMVAAMQSFHALTDAERAALKPLSVRTITAKPGTTYADLAKRTPALRNAESQLRLLNAQYPTGEPVAGQTLKIID